MKCLLSLVVLMFMVTPVLAQEAEEEDWGLAVGFLYGSRAERDEAIDGFKLTEFRSAPLRGIKLMIGTPSESPNDMIRTEFEFARFSTDLYEDGLHFGTLNHSSIVWNVRWGKGLSPKRQVGGNLLLGLGASFSSFDNGPYVRELEEFYDVPVDVETGTGLAVNLGLGVEVRIARRVSLNFDYRIGGSSMKTDWKLAGGESSVDDFEKFKAYSPQSLVSVSYWFKAQK